MYPHIHKKGEVIVNHRRKTGVWGPVAAFAAMLACLVCLAPAPARATERTWQPIDTCEWSILDGELIVRPAGGAAEGVLRQPTDDMPWRLQSDNIVRATFQGTVHLEQQQSWRNAGLFERCVNLKSVDFSGLDTSASTDFSLMFEGCSQLESIINLSGLDTSAVTDMSDMFHGCSSLESIDLSGFDTAAVTDMRCMFSSCSSLSSLNLSGFDTAAVTDMRCMFSSCSSLSSLNLSGFDTSAVSNMGYMFDSCRSLKSLSLFGFDTKNVNNMDSMFYACSSLKTLNLSMFDTNAVTNMCNMFWGCTSLESLDLSGFDTGAVRIMCSMLYGCPLTKLTVGQRFAFHPAGDTYNHATLEGSWKSSADGKLYPGDALPSFVAATYTKTAPEPETFTVTFKADGRVFDTQQVEEGKTAARPATDPVKEGHAFAAWQLDGSDYDFGTPVTADIELIAKFEEVPEPTPEVDKAALQAKYDEVKALKADGYTADSWKAFNSARAMAKRVLDNDKAEQTDVALALQSLVDAHAALKKIETPQIDKAELAAAVERARALKAEDYKTMTWHPFASALDAAEKALADDKADQAAVDAAVKALADARKGLKLVEKVSFSDVDGGTPHRDDVLWLAANGISKGWPTAEGAFEFRPYAAVTRADMAAFLYRLVGEPAFDEGAVSFADVDEGAPHRRAILWLASEGISRGWTGPDGSLEFRPYAQIARCDMAAFLYRLAGEPAFAAGGGFADVDASTPHREAVLWMAASGVSAGWTEADGTRTFRPYAQIVRCDMAAFLHRMADKGLVAPR